MSGMRRKDCHVRSEGSAPIINGLPSRLPDIDPEETSEWLASMDAVLREYGPQRARYLMLRLIEHARIRQVGVPALSATDYVNTIPLERGAVVPRR